MLSTPKRRFEKNDFNVSETPHRTLSALTGITSILMGIFKETIISKCSKKIGVYNKSKKYWIIGKIFFEIFEDVRVLRFNSLLKFLTTVIFKWSTIESFSFLFLTYSHMLIRKIREQSHAPRVTEYKNVGKNIFLKNFYNSNIFLTFIYMCLYA